MCIRDSSGARGSMNQIKQLAGMRGLLANTAGLTIEMPDVYKRQNYVCLLKFDPRIRHPVEYKSKEWLILR